MTQFLRAIDGPMALDLFTGICFLLAGAMLLFREILFGPATRTFPCAPLAVRIAMFATGAFMVWFGMQFLGRPPTGAPFAGPSSHALALLVAGIVVYSFVLLVNAFLERRPLRIWISRARIDARSGFDTADVRRFLSGVDAQRR